MNDEAGESLEIVTPDNQNTDAADQIAGPAPQENTDADAAAQAKDDDEESHRVPKGVQKRIDRLTRERYRLEGELEAMRRQAQPPAKPETREPSAGRPSPDQFASYEDFTAALVRHEAEQIIKARDSQAEQSKAQQSATARDREWAKRMDAAREAYPDIDDVIGGSDVPVSQAMVDVLQRHPKGADLAYYLGKHPDAAERIAGLDAVSAAIELAEIGATLARPAAKKQTSAPAPISPVGQRAAVSKDPDKMTADEWLAWRNAQLRKR